MKSCVRNSQIPTSCLNEAGGKVPSELCVATDELEPDLVSPPRGSVPDVTRRTKFCTI